MAGTGVLVGRGYVSIRPEFEGDWSRQASSRADSAGKSAGAGFSKAFGAGVKGIGLLAGVAVAANLSNVVAASAVLAPALATAGTAAGALKLGLSGVGDAFKAAFADGTADAQAAASATKAVESAQRGLANAQRSLADARVQAAERVRDAQRSVADAERDLGDAQADARQAQASLTDARRDAVRTLQDMNQSLAEGQLNEREAVIRLKEAQKELTAARSNPGVTPEELAKLQLAYDRAKLNLTEQRTETNRLAADTKKANKAGVDGSTQVVAAQKRIADANEGVADRQRALAKAQGDVTRAGVDGARQVADAQRSVADAARAVADAQAAAAAQTSALDKAMAKLAPNARGFVTAIKALAPAWAGMQLSVQNRLFDGLGTSVTSLAQKAIPILKTRLTETAGIWNAMGKSAIGAAGDMAKSGMLDKILAGANKAFGQFKQVPGQVVTAFGQLAVAAQPAFQQLTGQLAGAITSFTDGLTASFKSGGLQQAIDTAFAIISQLGTALGNALAIVSEIFKAASDAGGSIVGTVGAVLAELKKIFASPEIQAAMRTLFASIAQIVGAIVPVIGSIVSAVVPLLAAIAPTIATIASVLGPVLQQLATSLGAALLPIITSLMPVVEMLGLALVRIVQLVTPLLKPIGDLIAGIVTALAPALGPIIDVIVGLVAVLVGPLTSIIQALTPVFLQLGSIISDVFQAMQPFFAGLVDIVSQVATLLSGVFVTVLHTLLTALAPLIPVGIQLVQTVFAALTPILPIVGKALTDIGAVFMLLLPPLAALWSSLAQQILPIIQQLAPVFSMLASTLAGVLAAALPPLIQALLILVGALIPIFPLIGQILGIVVGLGASLLKQLLPPLMQLVQSAAGLLIALLPILPPLAELIGLVVKLAVGVLSVLLPPLLKLVGFLVGLLAGALGTVIGWLASFVGWIATKVGPIVKWLAGVITAGVTKIVSIFQWLYDKLIGHSILPDIINFIRGPFAAVFRWIYNNIIKPIWEGISSTISGIWNKGIKPAFNAIKAAVGKVGDAFRVAKDAIGKQWDKIKNLTRDPIKWVIDIVYNKGMVGLWNAAAKVLPITKLKPFKFAEGGSVYGAGTATSDSIPALLSNGEHVWTAKEVRGAGGHSAVESLRRQAAGNAYAKGGAVGDIVGAHGGIGDWFGGSIKKIGSVLGSAKDWVLGGISKAAQLAAKPVRSLINSIPGTGGGFGTLVKALPTALLDKALSAIKGGEEKELSAGGQWMKPVDVAYGTKFGVSGPMWSSGHHTGLDFPAAVGKAVKAVAAGQVSSATSGGPYGNHILLNHGGKLQSLYAHMSKMLVTSGAVKAGQQIGRVGATGNVTGPHLHLEARVSGKPVDPMSYLTGGGGGSGGKGVARWRGIVQQALRMTGQPAGYTDLTLRRMNQESGGDPNVVNRWDSNWTAGHPSVGLMQVIGPTFRSFAGSMKNQGPFSYGVSTNPLANVYASMRYALSRYSSLPSAYNRPGGYANGGNPQSGEWAWAGERGPELIRFGSPSTVFSHKESMSLASGSSAAASPALGDLLVKVFVGSEEISRLARTEVHRANGELLVALDAGGGG